MPEWEFIADPDLRDRCDHVWVMTFEAYGTHEIVTASKRCSRDGKYRNGDRILCGVHAPGVGRWGSRRVPKDSAHHA